MDFHIYDNFLIDFTIDSSVIPQDFMNNLVDQNYGKYMLDNNNNPIITNDNFGLLY